MGGVHRRVQVRAERAPGGGPRPSNPSAAANSLRCEGVAACADTFPKERLQTLLQGALKAGLATVIDLNGDLLDVQALLDDNRT